MSDEPTSEQLYGIPKQPEPTCPMIDAAIRKLKDGEGWTRGYSRLEDVDDLKNVIEGIEREIFSWGTVEQDLEAIREHVEKIRDWGEAWKQRALECQCGKRQETE